MKGILARNTLVKQVEAQIEQRLRAGVRDNYMKIVVAGMKAAMSGGDKSILAQMRGSKDVVRDAVEGAIGLVGTLRRAAKGVMPVDALIPAAMTLMLEALDYAERVGMITLGKDTIDQATQLFIETLLPRLGMTPQKLGQVTSQVHQVMQDPERMAKLQGVGVAQPQPGAQ